MPEVAIAVVSAVDVALRLQAYKAGRTNVPPEEQEMAEVYAEATYLKYQSANDVFGVTVASVEALKVRLKTAEEETLLLIEAIRSDSGEHLGALLLRVAWTGDVVVDFVGTNVAATKYGDPPIKNAGAMLLYCALAIAKDIDAEQIYAETARHSEAWWSKLLVAGDKLVKVDNVDGALARVEQIVAKQGKITIKSN